MLEPGDTVAGYRIERQLGHGGMGVVYEATELSLDRRVALKVIAPELSTDPSFRARFERERRLQAQLVHPNVVPVFRAGDSEGGLYLVMALIDGCSLDHLLAEDPGPPAIERTISILRQVAAALDAAHEMGLVHRDLKPQNILVDGRDRAYLADFGLTRERGQERMTSTGRFLGTVEYAAPELSRGEESTEAGDIYSLTCVLYECLIGRPPFVAESQLAVAIAHSSDDPPQPSEERADLPSSIDRVIARGMAKDAAERFPSARSLIEAASASLAHLVGRPGEGRRLPAPPAEARPKTKAGREPVSARRGRTTAGSAISPPLTPATGFGAQETELLADHAARPARRRLPAGLLFGIGVVCIGALGFGIGHGASHKGGVNLTSSQQARFFALEFSGGWRHIASGPKIPGLHFHHALALAAPSASRAGITVGMTGAQGRLLLPRRFVDELSRSVPRQTQVVRLGGHAAYRYPNVHPRGFSRALNLYVLPTDKGVATVACYGRAGSSRLAECEQIAGSLSVRGAQAYRLGPSRAYATALDRTLKGLEHRQRADGRRLAHAGTPQRQGEAARNLEHDFSAASQRLDALKVSPRDATGNASLAASLDGAAAAFRDLAAAASTNDREAYGAARRLIHAREQVVDRAIRGLRPLGYRASQSG